MAIVDDTERFTYTHRTKVSNQLDEQLVDLIFRTSVLALFTKQTTRIFVLL